MNKLRTVLAAGVLALAAVSATGATAQSFSGPRASVSVGAGDVTGVRGLNDVSYELAVGIDAPINESNWRAGVELSADRVFNRNRELAASVRVGYVIGNRVMPYVKAGYTNLYAPSLRNDVDGFRVGGGVEYALTRDVFVAGEYRYSDFSRNVGKHGAVATIGYRF